MENSTGSKKKTIILQKLAFEIEKILFFVVWNKYEYVEVHSELTIKYGEGSVMLRACYSTC